MPKSGSSSGLQRLARKAGFILAMTWRLLQVSLARNCVRVRVTCGDERQTPPARLKSRRVEAVPTPIHAFMRRVYPLQETNRRRGYIRPVGLRLARLKLDMSCTLQSVRISRDISWRGLQVRRRLRGDSGDRTQETGESGITGRG